MSNNDNFIIPRVFISYSWTSSEHEKWVLNLAEKLVSNGVDVKLDKWDLKAGQDKNAFMEKIVSSEEIDKVLIICDKGYKQKADGRVGGVGVETIIISSETYKDVDQDKFIPIIAESNGDEIEANKPRYLQSRLHIDMSTDNTFLKGYEELLRTLFNRPKFQKPQIGKPPLWLFEESTSESEPASKQIRVADIDKSLQNDMPPSSSNNEIREAAFTVGSTQYFLNGQMKQMHVAPYVKEGRTFLPVRYVAEALGVASENVIWNEANKIITLLKGNRVVQMKVGSKVMMVNGVSIFMDTEPEISNGSMMLPFRFIAQALGATVSWDEATMTVRFN